jgi:acetyl-CoA carboxylase biotin carboxylase subunit
MAAKAAGYSNAGTIEFICDSPEKIYFMEMNTRIQVEHPVTESITGVDLIRQQILIACGEKLPFTQKDIVLRGCAMELRINAEDPAKGFAPAPGRVAQLVFPAGPNVRIDSHMYPGYTIPSEYDSMVAKMIVTGATREEVMARAQRCLAELQVSGVPTTAKFHEALLQHPAFIKGDVTTKFLEEEQPWFDAFFARNSASNLGNDAAAILAAIGFMMTSDATPSLKEKASKEVGSRWADSARFAALRNFRS